MSRLLPWRLNAITPAWQRQAPNSGLRLLYLSVSIHLQALPGALLLWDLGNGEGQHRLSPASERPREGGVTRKPAELSEEVAEGSWCQEETIERLISGLSLMAYQCPGAAVTSTTHGGLKHGQFILEAGSVKHTCRRAPSRGSVGSFLASSRF